MNKEIVIPQGYEARIEGNKVIFEQKKCEDERIRKNLIEWVREFKKLNPTNPDHNAECSEAIDWLEKQREQPTNEEMLRTLHVEYEKGVADTIAKYEKKEQKPAEWGEEDEDALKYLHKLIDFGYSKDFTGAQTAAEMRRWVNKFLRPQLHWKPSEEQMAELLKALTPGKVFDCDILAELYEQLDAERRN